VPVVVDYAGPGELVTEQTGYKVPIGQRDQIVADLRVQLERIADDPSGLGDMSARAYDRAHSHFTWEAKAKQVAQVYDWVLGDISRKPDLIPMDD
jgi:glycosyltransferase involved in cell wall biosynthesis